MTLRISQISEWCKPFSLTCIRTCLLRLTGNIMLTSHGECLVTDRYKLAHPTGVNSASQRSDNTHLSRVLFRSQSGSMSLYGRTHAKSQMYWVLLFVLLIRRLHRCAASTNPGLDSSRLQSLHFLDPVRSVTPLLPSLGCLSTTHFTQLKHKVLIATKHAICS